MSGAQGFGWGIVGTGRMAGVMAAALRGTAGARLAAVCSRDAARAVGFAGAHGIAVGCVDMEEMLGRADVEVCYIATPTHRHRDDCLAALAAGKHVLCEKPLGVSAAEAREIAGAAAAAGRFCMEALWTHFIPAVGEAARLLRAGAIGTPLHIAASFGLPTLADDPVFQPPGGGALLDRGCYPISLALRLFGPVADVRGSVTRSANGVDTDAVMLIDFVDGNTAAIATSLTGYLANNLVVGGTNGRLVLPEPITSPAEFSIASARAGGGGGGRAWKQRLRGVPGVAMLARLRRERARFLPFRGDGYGHQLDEVHRCLQAGVLQSDVLSWDLSASTLEVIDALRPDLGL